MESLLTKTPRGNFGFYESIGVRSHRVGAKQPGPAFKSKRSPSNSSVKVLHHVAKQRFHFKSVLCRFEGRAVVLGVKQA